MLLGRFGNILLVMLVMLVALLVKLPRPDCSEFFTNHVRLVFFSSKKEASTSPVKMENRTENNVGAGAPDEEMYSDQQETPLNMRIVMLKNLVASRNSSRSAEIQLTKNKRDCGFGAAKSLDYLRRLVQDSINAELSAVIERYLQKFFDPAVNNIRRNKEEVTDEHISCLCQQMLEEAKKMYVFRGTSALDSSTAGSPLSDSETMHRQRVLINKHIPSELRRPFYRDQQGNTDSDGESDVSVASVGSRRRKRPKQFQDFYGGRPPSRSSTPGGPTTTRLPELSLEDIPKWNPERITPETKLVLGSKANKALGMESQRGRIYMKHTGLFKYVGDNDDKSWLYAQGIKSMKCGGRAFFIVLDDILELSQTLEYRNNPDVNMDQLHGFVVPDFIREKMKNRMTMVYEAQKYRLKAPQSPTRSTEEALRQEKTNFLHQTDCERSM